VVTIPLEYRFPKGMKEVFIRRIGDEVILLLRPTDWSGFLASGMCASDDFMTEVEDLPVQERNFMRALFTCWIQVSAPLFHDRIE
jgi:antitoxin VapB